MDTNNKGLHIKCQDENQKTSYFPQQYIENLCLKQARMTPIEQKVFNYLVYKSTHFKDLSIRQKVIASCIGKSRQHVNYAIKRLEEKKLIIKDYRYKKACVYKLHPIFEDLDIRKKLSAIFDAFKLLPLYLFLASALSMQNIQAEKGTLSLRNKDIYYSGGSYKSNLTLERECWESKLVYEEPPSSLKSEKKDEDNPIPGYIRRLKWLALTKWGQIKLTVFPETVINAAAEKRKWIVTKENPYSYFFKLCKDLCIQYNITPEWRTAYELEAKYNMPDNARAYIPEEIKRLNEQLLYRGQVRKTSMTLEETDLTKKHTVPAVRQPVWSSPLPKSNTIHQDDLQTFVQNLSNMIEKARSKAPHNSIDIELIKWFVSFREESVLHLSAADLEFLRLYNISSK